jgi:hypothetical protein
MWPWRGRKEGREKGQRETSRAVHQYYTLYTEQKAIEKCDQLLRTQPLLHHSSKRLKPVTDTLCGTTATTTYATQHRITIPTHRTTRTYNKQQFSLHHIPHCISWMDLPFPHL